MNRIRHAARWIAGAMLVLAWASNAPAAPPPAAPEPAEPPGASADTSSPSPGFQFRHRRGNDFTMFHDREVPRGEIHHGQLVCLFCDLTIDGEVDGGVVVILGNLRLSGAIHDDTVAVLSNVAFSNGAAIDGDFVNVVGTLTGHAEISGDRVHIPLAFLPSSLGASFGVLGTLLTWVAVVWTSLLFLVFVVLAAVAPDRVRIVAQSAPASLFLAYLVGLGTYVAVSLVNFALVATVLGIPLAGLVWILFLIAKWIGLAGIYLWIGRSIGRMFGRELTTLPAVLLGFFPFMLLQLVPVLFGGFGLLLALGIRLLYWLLLEIPAVGLSVLTRGGGRLRDR